MRRPVSFTLESDAVTGDRWNEYITELVDLAGHCDLIDVARTTGARREASAGKRDPVAADRRRVLMEQLPEVQETAVLGVTRWGEGVYGDDEDQARLEAIRRVLWHERRTNLSETNDVIHLATHSRAGRDYFVTTDRRMHAAREELIGLGIRVVAPEEAIELARAACEMPSGKD
jgi:hypothetical protein